MSFDEEFDDSIIDDYVAESREHLDSIEDDFLFLEKNRDQPEQSRVDKVFRAIHSIKGSAGFLGFTKINDLAHVMETLLTMLRKGEIKAETRFIDALLEGVDFLNLMLSEVRKSNDVDISSVRQKLSDLIKGETSPKASMELKTFVSFSDSGGRATGFTVSKYTITNIPVAHNKTFVLRINLTDLTAVQGKSPVGLVRKLLDNGTIIDGRIEPPEHDLRKGLPEGPLYYMVLYATALDQKKLGTILDLSQGDIDVAKVSGESKKEEKIPVAVRPAPAEAPAGDVPGDNRAGEASAVATKELAPPVREKTPPAEPGVSSPAETRSSTLRISVDIADTLMMLAGELVLVRNQQLLHLDRTDPLARSIVQRLDMVTSELQETIMQTRMQPLDTVFGKFPRVVRELAKKLGKQLDIIITGNEVELDKTIIESLSDPLTHLIRNCCDHGIEDSESRAASGKPPEGRIWLSASHEGGQITIKIRDDGKGIDPRIMKEVALKKGLKTQGELEEMSDRECVSLIMLPGFSTAKNVTDVSGRGVGMDVVRTNLEKLGGAVEIESTKGQGTTIHLRLPLTLAIIPSLIVKLDGYRYAIPQVNLEELVCLYDEDILEKLEYTGDHEVYRLRDRLLPMLRLREVFEHPTPFTSKDCARIAEKYRALHAKVRQEIVQRKVNGEPESAYSDSLNFVVLRVGSNRFGLIVDQVLGTEEIVVKPMHPALKSLGCYSGATVMGDGQVAMILDIEGITRHSRIFIDSEPSRYEVKAVDSSLDQGTQMVLLFKCGEKEQFALPLPLIRRIERIHPVDFVEVGGKEFISIDGVSTLLIRLDKYLDVSPCVLREEMFLLLPKHIKKPFGILVSVLHDIAETSFELNVESYMEPGLMGTALINNHMTLFIDMYQLAEKAEPGWFEGDRGIENRRAATILLAEDSPFFRRMMRGYLEDAGHTVVAAENGKLALALLDEHPFDLIVSDLEMPEMDGWEFMKEVRAGRVQNALPSLAVTSLDQEKYQKKALEAGFTRYEVKIDRYRLLRTVDELLQSIPEGTK